MLLAILLFITISTQVFLDNTINNMLRQIDNVQTQILDNENNLNQNFILENFDKMRNYWESNEGKLALCVDHKNISNVGQSLVRLKASLEENDILTAKTEIYLLYELVYVLQKLSTFNIHNVF